MFEKLRQARAWCVELREPDDSLASAELAKPDGTTPGRLLWYLPTPGRPDTFMRLNADQANHDRFLVPVNAKVFNWLWLADDLNSPERLDGCPLHRGMTSGNEYRHVVDGFATGWDSPVPSANVAFERRHTPSIRFNDNVTRTLWLLANNVTASPVLVAGEDNAGALAKLAGTDGSIMRVSEVVHNPEKAPQSRQEPLDTKRGGVGQERVKNTSEEASRGQRRPSHGRGIGVDD